MKDYRYVFGLVLLPDQRICSICREIIPPGLMGAIRPPGQGAKALCDHCLRVHCEGLGLALQGVRLLRQAGAYRLGTDETKDKLSDHLVQYAVLLDQGARNTWQRLHPVAKLDCEHCLMGAFPDLPPDQSELLLEVFRAYQRLRFKLQNQDIYFMRCVAFTGYSADMKARAIERVETFTSQTDPDALCPRSVLALRFFEEPVVDLLPFGKPRV